MFVPHLTVAAVIHKDNQFLLVEEWVEGQAMFNQPAGHVEDNETIIDALQRETLEETGYRVQAQGLLGLYQWQNPAGETYFRYAIAADVVVEPVDPQLDPDIIAVHWLEHDQIVQLEEQGQLRSPLVMACIRDFQAGNISPLSLLKTIS